MNPILSVQHITKQFRIGAKQERYLSLRDLIANPFSQRAGEDKKFLALDDVSFDVNPGDSLGIIGRNGAGKSTLLKILSRITPPTSGKIIAHGRIASLLEVGTGFHPELSGRENIYMNGSILGMRKSEINRHFDAMVDFSGVEKFIDTPLKRFSSGMQLRLAFAVAAFLEPEVLIIDEVLAVGDAEFQKKCLGKMDEVSKSGRTVLFVSHDMTAIEQLCSKVIILQKGQKINEGPTHTLISDYLNNNKSYNLNNIWLTEKVQLSFLSFQPDEIISGGTLRISMAITYAVGAYPIITDCCILIYSLKGVRVSIIDLRSYIDRFDQQDNQLLLNIALENVNLVEGEYSIGLYYGIDEIKKEILDIAQLRIKPSTTNLSGIKAYLPQHRGFVELLNHTKIY